MKCPSCGAQNQTGKYCASCGAALDVHCASCGAKVPAGASYCTSCGEPVAGEGAAAEPASKAPWVIAAASVAVVAILVVLFLPDSPRRAAPAAGGAVDAPFMGSGGSPGAAGNGLSADMRTNADRLFNRIMTSAEQGNEAEVNQFMPMAIQAYGMVPELDNDGIYHLGLLYLTAGDYSLAMEQAERLLADEPNHLLGLAVAADASAAAGDSSQAAEYWQRFLDAYDTEAGKPLPEYVDHQPMLPEYQRVARQQLGQQ